MEGAQAHISRKIPTSKRRGYPVLPPSSLNELQISQEGCLAGVSFFRNHSLKGTYTQCSWVLGNYYLSHPFYNLLLRCVTSMKVVVCQCELDGMSHHNPLQFIHSSCECHTHLLWSSSFVSIVKKNALLKNFVRCQHHEHNKGKSSSYYFKMV